MATATSTAPTADGAGENQPRGGHRGRGRGRGRGNRGGDRGGYQGFSNDRGEDRAGLDTGRGRGGRGGRGRGRGGRGGRGNRDRAASNSQQDSAAVQPPPQPGGNGVFGARLTKDAEEKNTQQGEKKEGLEEVAGDDVEAEVCFICASPVAHQSVAPCNHRTCHICALRLRALYKTKACAHCRTEAATVIFTDDPEKRYEDYDASKDFFREDKNLGICYEKPEIFEDTVILLRYNCPEDECDTACLGWPDLHRHVRSVHSKWMCDLCTRNKKVFTHEHELFTKQELQRHEKFGDDKPGAIDQSGFKGHPECGFCRQRFYGDDELFAHCRDRHERCHLCDRRTGGNNPQYYMNYEALEQHFGKEHYPCLDSECLEKKFVVFDSEMDLKAHQLENHPNGLSKDARRDARRVDISAFNYRPQYEEPRRGGRRGGRGRHPNAEPMPASSGGHMSRAELAHQREREIHSAQSVTARSFGGSLSQPDPTPAQAQRPAASPRPANAQPVAPTSAPQSPRPAAALTPADQARQLRHNAVTERASNLLRNDKVKLDEFRERISAYTKGGISAGDLIDAFFALFDTSSDQLGKLIKELADIFEIPAKRDGLLKAWSDWKAINEDYPSLPGPAGANTTAAGVLGSGLGSSRVLKLKSSTAQSSRSGVARRYNSAAGPSSANQFPSLPPRNGGPAPKGPAPVAPTPSWLAARPSASTALSVTPSGSARASPAPSRVQSTANLSGAGAFPALPAAKKPTSTVFSPGYTGRGVIRADSNYTGANAWTSGAAGSAGNPTSPPPEDENVTRKGKKGKQIVFKWG
ncbi:E3 ubiquitin-protein ligase hel2 [Pseudocercospora fuligena]|uniref:RING-type E3 ubiquitin transferase n=1 Tax=Pseudocercospora fuligena TaxID=685502 RepID=A0A8H6RCU1_9PEZI|nr:E3 ubiquitin-protein ligase hel2 [Pseudocercospora fuligena]